MVVPLARTYPRIDNEDRADLIDDRRPTPRGRDDEATDSRTPAQGDTFIAPDTQAAADRLGIPAADLAAARNDMNRVLENDWNRRQANAPEALRRPYRRPTDQALDDELARRLGR